MNDKYQNLVHAVGKLALIEGESWRLAHPEIMDAYQAIIENQKSLSPRSIFPTVAIVGDFS